MHILRLNKKANCRAHESLASGSDH